MLFFLENLEKFKIVRSGKRVPEIKNKRIGKLTMENIAHLVQDHNHWRRIIAEKIEPGLQSVRTSKIVPNK